MIGSEYPGLGSFSVGGPGATGKKKIRAMARIGSKNDQRVEGSGLPHHRLFKLDDAST